MRSKLLDVPPEKLIGSYIEGAHLFTTPGATFSMPNAAWNTPAALDWHTSIAVGPNQLWDVVACAGVHCVTAVHALNSRMAFRTPANVAMVSGVGGISYGLYGCIFQPPVITTSFSMRVYARLMTDSTVAPDTPVWVSQEFNGNGANGRVLRDGNHFWIKASRLL